MNQDTVSLRLSALYSHHHWLQRWLNQHTACHETAADLTQDTFVRVLQNQRKKPQNITKPRAYLCCIARALLIDHWRRSDLEQALLEAFAALPEEMCPSAEEIHIMLETLCLLDAALAGLSAQTREAFCLSRFEHMSCSAIAAKQGCAEITVKRRLRRALVHCAQTIDIA